MIVADALALDAIARTASEIEPRPKDRLEATVILEALGYKDEDARALGFGDLFELADAVRDAARPYAWDEPTSEAPRRREHGFTLYLVGMFYNIGWVIMLVALFMGGQSLWAAANMPVAVSTAIGLGVVLGLASTGGVQQFAAWKLIYYRSQGNAPLARFVMRRSLLWGSIVLVGVALVAGALEVSVVGLPAPLAALSVGFLLLIGAYRLAMTPVFALKKFVALVLASVLALVTMFVAFRVLGMAGMDRVGAVVASQVFGLAVLLGTSVLFMRSFVFAERKEGPRSDDPPFYARRDLPTVVHPPRFWALAYDGVPYLVYGTMYFVFLFGDRLVSWFSPGLGPLALNYNSTYQIGVDLALLLLVPITAIKFPLLYRLSEYLEATSRRSSAVHPQSFGQGVARFHDGLLVRVVAASVLFAAVAFAFADGIVRFAGGDAQSVAIYRFALVGVVLFSVFLTNAVFAMAFRRIRAMAGLLVVAAAANYVLGALFAQAFGPQAVVFGFLVSALFLGASSSAYVLRLRRSADYAYFAAF